MTLTNGGRLQVNERQLLTCELSEDKDSWTFLSKWNVNFKGEYVLVHHNMSALDLKATLLKMPTLRDLSVEYYDDNQHFCSDGNVVTVEFNQDFGPQPPLIFVPEDPTDAQASLVTTHRDGVSVAGILSREGNV